MASTEIARKNKHEEFISHFARSGNATQAAVAAGYSERTARTQGYQLKVKLAGEIAHAVGLRIASAAPAALGTLIKLVESSDTDDRVRLAAAKDILDRAGYNASNKVEISTMDTKTDDQLRAELRELMGNVIDVTPE